MKLKLGTRSRAQEIELRALDPVEGQPKRYRMSLSSETPVRRFFGDEILRHTSQAVDMSRARRGLSVRDTHFGDVVGIVENIALEGGRMVGDVIFSPNARGQEFERDVTHEPPIRRFVSVRYAVERAVRTRKGTEGAPDEVTITRWQPIHVAFEPDPADFSVGVGRNAAEGEDSLEVEIEDGDRAVEERNMPCQTCKKDPCACQPTAGAPAADRSAGQGSAPAAPAPVPAAQPSGNGGGAAVVDDRSASRASEIAEIVRLCQAHNVSAKAPEWIERGFSIDHVSSEILKLKHTQGGGAAPAEVRPPSPVSLPAKDAKRYSYARALLCADNPSSLTGLEKETHEEIRSNMPASFRPHDGVLIPMGLRNELGQAEILSRALEIFFTGRDPYRDRGALDSKTGAGAAELVFEQAGGLIPLLRNNTVVMQAGAQVLTGLTAPIAFSKQTGAATGYWVGENPAADVTESELTTGVISLAPKTIQATTSFSRQLLALANEDAEAMVRRDLAAVHALLIDRAAYHGKGAGGEPTGIYQAPDVIAKAFGGGATWAIVVDMIAQCADANALDGSLGWIVQTLLAGRCMTVPKVASAAAGFLWEGNVRDGSMAGYPARSTSQLSKTMSTNEPTGGTSYGITFGNWADMIIGMWGAMEVIPDPYALKKRGLIELTTFQMVDILLRHGQSFVKGTGATLA